MHPRNFDSDKIVPWYLYAGTSTLFMKAEMKFCISSTPCFSAVNRMATRTLREKNNDKAESFFRLNFNVYINVDNRVIKNNGDQFRWKKSMKIL